MAANQQQVAALFQSVLAQGIDAKEVASTVKALVEARIFSLEDLNASNAPSSIDAKIRKKLLSKKQQRSFSSSTSPKAKRVKTTPIDIPPVKDIPASILINRSPVLTMWATVVARKLFSLTLEEALSIGHAVSSSLAKAKGTSLGIYSSDKKSATAATKPNDNNENREYHIFGMVISAKQTQDGIRAMLPGEELADPGKTWSLLQRKFGDALGFAFAEMSNAAAHASNEHLDATAYQYYMHIRPSIPSGTKGWGAHGQLYTNKLSSYYQPETEKDTNLVVEAKEE